MHQTPPSECFKLIPAAHLFLVRDNKILLLRRANTGYEDGKYSVPAGHIDGNEPVTRAMAREALEEAVLHIKPEDLQVVHVMHRYKEDGERVDFFLTANTWTGEPTIGEPDKCDDLRWWPIDQLPENMIPYVRSAIQSYLQGVPFSEFGW